MRSPKPFLPDSHDAMIADSSQPYSSHSAFAPMSGEHQHQPPRYAFWTSGFVRIFSDSSVSATAPVSSTYARCDTDSA